MGRSPSPSSLLSPPLWHSAVLRVLCDRPLLALPACTFSLLLFYVEPPVVRASRSLAPRWGPRHEVPLQLDPHCLTEPRWDAALPPPCAHPASYWHMQQADP